MLFAGSRGALRRRHQFYASAWRPALKAAGLADDRGRLSLPWPAILGDTVETVSRMYAHWLRDDRDEPAAVLERMLAPVAGADSNTEGILVPVRVLLRTFED
ncbi:MAG: hypothetical protein ACRD0U_01070 [Acidimicrobiales bacterium]